MKIIPMPGQILLTKVKVDFEVRGSRENPVYLPVGDKSSSFFNRSKVVALPEPPTRPSTDAETPGYPGICIIEKHHFEVGDIVITTSLAGELGVPGQMKIEGNWREVLLCPIDQVVGVIEDDEAELEEAPMAHNIVAPSGNKVN